MAIVPYVASHTDLKTYIKERLGFPVINIEITDEQMNHAINMTIEKFVEIAEGGVNFRFMILAVTAGTQSYTLANDVYSIYNVWDTEDNNFDAVFPERIVADIFGANTTTIVKSDLLTLDMVRGYLKDIDFLLRVQVLFDFNPVTKTFYLIETPSVNINLGVAFYEKIDYSDLDSPVYDHQWVKNYATALSKKQWASNLTKYAGSLLPEGLTMDAATILQEANTEIEKLDLELEEMWQIPIDFFIG